MASSCCTSTKNSCLGNTKPPLFCFSIHRAYLHSTCWQSGCWHSRAAPCYIIVNGRLQTHQTDIECRRGRRWRSNRHATDVRAVRWCTDLDLWGHVTSSVTWPFDSPCAVSCRWSVVTIHLSGTVNEIFSFEDRRPWPFVVTWRHRSVGRSVGRLVLIIH